VAGFAPINTYSAAKAWCTAFTEILAQELSGSGVSATALCPGLTVTEMHERVKIYSSRLPKAMWLDADSLVRDCLNDVKAGKVISVPGVQYKVIADIAQLVPNRLARAVSGRVGSLRRSKG